MSRIRGEKGKNGETERQIIFAILNNQIKNGRGLTKKQVAELVESVTKKDRDGIRKKVAKILGPESPLKSMLQIEEHEMKKFVSLRPRNLRDVAILYNFLKPDKEILNLQEVRDFIGDKFIIFIEEIVDFLYLWDPLDPVYGLDEGTLNQFVQTGHAYFYPEKNKKSGPEYLKLIGNKYKIFETLFVKLPDIKRLLNLIGNFERFREEILSNNLELPLEVSPFKTNMPFLFDLEGPLIESLSDKKFTHLKEIWQDYLWFWNMWISTWTEFVYFPFYEHYASLFPGKEFQEIVREVNSNMSVEERQKILQEEISKVSIKYEVPEESIRIETSKTPYEVPFETELHFSIPEKYKPVKGPKPTDVPQYYNLFTFYNAEGKYYELKIPDYAQKQKSVENHAQFLFTHPEETKIIEKWTWKER
jgi:hypothetical protein